MLEYTVLIVTHNRAAMLSDALAALGAMRAQRSWELVVVDNGSRDSTHEVVTAAAAALPVRVRYLYDAAPGKYAALNSGIRAAQGRIIVATDDDAFVCEDWLDRTSEGFERFNCGFVGGPVFPVWGGPQPEWIDEQRSLAGKVLALQDYGTEPREYGTDIAWPLGVNVAYRREVFEQVGYFDSALGRVAGTLRNQSQREWHIRARAAGVTGFYLPRMVVRHFVPPDRMTKAYFRRWFYWHGVSRAILHRKTGLDLFEPDSGAAAVPDVEIARVPLAVWRRMALSGASWARRCLRGDATGAFEYELWVAFCAGVVHERWAQAPSLRPALDTYGGGTGVCAPHVRRARGV